MDRKTRWGADRARRGLVCAFAVALVFGAPWSNAPWSSAPWPGAEAAEWIITPSFGVFETFTDNVNLTSTNEESDFITRAGPAISVRGTGSRVKTSLDYRLERLFFAKNSDRDRNISNLRGAGTVELIKHALFINAEASINEQAVSNRAGISTSPINTTGNRTTVQAFNFRPIFRHHFGKWADSESSYSFRRTAFSTSNLASTITNQGTFVLRSGTRFGRLGWTLTANSSNTERSGGSTVVNNSSFKRRLAEAQFRYAVTRHVSLLSSVGFEKITNNTLRDQPNQMIWSAGVQLRPGPRSSLQATYGRRFNRNIVSASASYEFSPRTRFSASFEESIQTTQQLLTQNLSFVAVAPDGTLIDTRTGLPFIAGNSAFGLTNNAFRRQRFDATLSGERGRNTYTFRAFAEKRNTDATGLKQTVLGGSVILGRRLSRRTNVGLTARYRNTDFGTTDNRKDGFLAVNANLSYRVYRNVQATLSYSLSRRDSTQSSANLTENVVSIGLRKTF